jgi:hypothetical protein
VFAAELVMVAVVVALARRMQDTPPEGDARADYVGTALSALGLGLVVFGVLRAGDWGFVNPHPGAPAWLSLSPVLWPVLAGGLVLRGILTWEHRRQTAGRAVLIDPALLHNSVLRGGLTSFFLQYLLQAGLFFTMPLFLSVALGRAVGRRHGRAHPDRGAGRAPVLPPHLAPQAGAAGLPVVRGR